jgi:tetratricopeptide (TPR) repeat protein
MRFLKKLFGLEGKDGHHSLENLDPATQKNIFESKELDFIQFLNRTGFPHLALSLIDAEMEHFSEPEVLQCTKGVIQLEGLGRGYEAMLCFEKAINLNPSYPQALRLASTYAVDHDKAIHFQDMFFSHLANHLSKPPSGFQKHTELDRLSFKNGKVDSFIRKTSDMLLIHTGYYMEMIGQKNTVKQLAFGSIVAEIMRQGKNGISSVPQDMQWAIVRDCIEQGIKLSADLWAKQKEYMKNTTIPEDNLPLQDAALQAEYYLENYDAYDTIVLNWRAHIALHLERYEECITYADRAIDVQPKGYFFHYMNKFSALVELGRSDEAASLIPLIVQESGNSELKTNAEDQIARQKKSVARNPDELLGYIYHYIEGSAYAAKEELAECERIDRMGYLKYFTNILNTGGTWDQNNLFRLFSQYTPALIYEWLYKNAIYTNPQFMDPLIEIATNVHTGFFGESATEFCWLFALSQRDYDYFTPLRKKMFDLVNAENAAVIISLRRMLPLVYQYLKLYGSDQWPSYFFYNTNNHLDNILL